MKQSEIVCTLGTTTDNKSILEKMVEFGMTGCRINTAYATIADYDARINMVREVAKEMGTSLEVMLDIKGPQVRLGNCEYFNISAGSMFDIGFPENMSDNKISNEVFKVYFSKDLSSDLKVGDKLLIENGTITTRVENNYGSGVCLRVLEPGEGIIHKYMGVNVPGVYLNIDRLSEKDKEVIRFGLDKGVEQIALSFVRDASDVKNCYDFMKDYSTDKASKTELCLKIEDRFGVNNLKSILDYVKLENIKTSVMVARGDLFVELEPWELPFAQEYITNVCKKYSVPVIVGTGILSSMQNAKTPTRSEVSDVYSILKSEANGFMLSGETSYGTNPEHVVKLLGEISREYYTRKMLEGI